MNGLDLYTGSGIGSLTLRHTIPNYRTVCFVENDPYCQAVLVTRIKDGLLDDAPIWDDVRTFDGTKWRGKVDIVSGGFPCQPFSVAGQRQGETDERNLWPDTVRIIGEVRPRYAFLENVPGLLSSGYFETILCDLTKIGYDIEWDVVGASDVGANHRRKRLWILAYPDRTREPQSQGIKQDERERIGNGSQDVAYSESIRRRGRSDENGRGGRQIQTPRPSTGDKSAILADTETIYAQGCHRGSGKGESRRSGWWQVEPDVGRVAHGVAFRVDRLKMLGNGWVPAVVARIIRAGR